MDINGELWETEDSVRVQINFWILTKIHGQPHALEVTINRWYSTTDREHAHELALREWPDIKPDNYAEGTLTLS